MAAEGRPFIFRINENGSGPNLLVQVCAERGWREYNEGAASRDNWNLWWRSQGFPVSIYKSLKTWQFTNHIPKASSICRKDTLARFLRCMRNVYGSVYDFSPPVYNLPLEFNKLVAECSRNRLTGLEEDDVWICKPVGQSQGRGIYLFRKLSELTYDSNTIVQRYIRNPFLIGGYKFDLRLYVCVPSYHPLTVYLYQEGLVRFSTDKFSLNDLNNPFCHLTNSSLNKLGPGYYEMKDRVGSAQQACAGACIGCKWSLKQLRHYLAQAGLCDWLLWQRVAAIVVLTVLAQVPSIPATANCFEFLGFDILVDSSLRPWLLEVNLSPALGNDCDVDPAVKKPMLHDLFDLLGLPVCNTGLQLFTLWSSPDAHAANGAGVGNGGSGRCISPSGSCVALSSCASSTSASPRVLPGGVLRGGGGGGSSSGGGGGTSSTSPVSSRSSPTPRRGLGGARRSRDRIVTTEVAMTAVQAAMRWRRRHTLSRSGAVDNSGSRNRHTHASEDDTAEDDDSSSLAPSVSVTSVTRRARRRSARRSCTSGSAPPATPSSAHSQRGGSGSSTTLTPVICVTALTGSSATARPLTPHRGAAGRDATTAASNVFGPHYPSPLRVTPLSISAQEGTAGSGIATGQTQRARSASRRTSWTGPGRRGRCSASKQLSPGDRPRARPSQPTLRTRLRTRTCRPTSASTSAGISEEPWGRGMQPPGAATARSRGLRARGRCPPPALWGNGKDWGHASAGEGGWVRIFPLGASSAAMGTTTSGPAPGAATGGPMAGGEGMPSFGDTVVRRAVYDINRMLRVARDVARKYSKGNDGERNKALADALAFSGEPWLPLK